MPPTDKQGISPEAKKSCNCKGNVSTKYVFPEKILKPCFISSSN